jgi:hypothetical protein
MTRLVPFQVLQTLCLAILAVAFAMPEEASGQSLLKMFRSRKVDANPDKDYTLTEVEGPWLILAETFTGPTGEQQAKQLVLELRRDFDLPAWVYHEKFDFSRPDIDVGPNHKPLRYANPSSYEAFAVLVGEFDSVDHPDIDAMLSRIKKLEPATFANVTPESEVGAMSAIRRMHSQLNDLLKAENRAARGPMFNAFVTRNPILPESFTQSPEVDSFVRKLNQDVEHSLLKCNGKFTVVVRTFEGLSTTVINGRTKNDIEPDKDRLDSSMALANKMVTALRAKGVEAYEFHDRSRSLVTIGSFDSLGFERQKGFEYLPEIQHIMKEYSGTQRVGLDPNRNMVTYTNNIKKIPYDVSPYPIAIPKMTKRSFYQAALGRDQ